MNKLLIIHPKDSSTVFLNSIWSFLLEKFGDKISFYNIAFSDEEHLAVIKELSNYDGENILFLGHGASSGLKGAENEDYSKNIFIGKDELTIFKNKSVLSFSCKSSDLFRYATDFSYIGFDDIPSDMYEVLGAREFESSIYNNVDEDVIEKFKGILVGVISNSVYEWIANSYNIENVYHRIKIRVNNELVNLLKSKEEPNKKKALLNLLNDLKRNMRYHHLVNNN
ncbi:MAG: hypothetical protein ACOYBS_04905 [Flavobacterium sp.]